MQLLYANRGRDRRNMAPWNSCIHTTKPHAVELDEFQLRSAEIVMIDLSVFTIQGSWCPGDYHLALRAQNSHNPNDWHWTSEISRPIHFEMERSQTEKGPQPGRPFFIRRQLQEFDM